MSPSDPTDQALAAIASILDQPASLRTAEPVEEKPIAQETVLEIVQEITSAPTVTAGYFKIGPGPLAAIRLKWTVRGEADNKYYVDETIGDNSAAVVSGPMSGDEAVKFVNDRENEARMRFEKLKSEMTAETASSKAVDTASRINPVHLKSAEESLMIRLLTCLAAAFFLTIGSAYAQQQPSRLDDIIKRGTLRVGMTGDYLPFTYFDRTTAKFRGFDVDMAEALGNALGVKVEYVQTAWPTLTKDFEADNFDVAMGGISITLERQKKGMFSAPIMREGKTPIARCSDMAKYGTLADIDRPGTRVVVNPGGTNERFARAHLKNAEIKTYSDNVTIFDEIAKGNADLMMTDSSETRYQQKLHPGVLCAVHPDKPFDFAEKAYWLQRDVALKAFVDQWLHIKIEDGSFEKIYATWFE